MRRFTSPEHNSGGVYFMENFQNQQDQEKRRCSRRCSKNDILFQDSPFLRLHVIIYSCSESRMGSKIVEPIVSFRPKSRFSRKKRICQLLRIPDGESKDVEPIVSCRLKSRFSRKRERRRPAGQSLVTS